MMKKLFALTALWFVISPFAQAQISTEKNGLTYKVTGIDYLAAPDYLTKNNFKWLDWTRNWEPGAEIGYYRYLNHSFNLGVPLKLGSALLKETGYFKKMYASAGANLIYKLNNGYLLKEEARIAPYLYAGLAGKRYWRNGNEWDFVTPIGGGVNLRLAENWWLQLETEKRLSHILKRDSWLYSGGFLYTFGGAKDQDKDGITDDKDACPTEFGKKELMGCPDRDNDGIADNNDECPDEMGTAELGGCPDKDGDKVRDKEDGCPDVAGLAQFNGCPDKDGDGVADKDDACPENAGLRELQGCPDSDGDGIADKNDKCPTEKGVAQFGGCPDTDGDGIADKDDKCPKEKGIAAFAGCPDTDGDGIADASDKCPKEKGVAENNGCPAVDMDTDKDGIMDKEDKCPNIAGVKELQGCPKTDRDNDGILDEADKCPDQAGTAANKGCPEIKVEDKKVLLEAMYLEFETGSAVISKQGTAVLDKVYDVMVKYPAYHMSIVGHTDSQGTPASNMTLSERRAKQCYDYLLKKGAKAEAMAHAGAGDTNPIADNKTAEGRKRNRRVEFVPIVK